MWKTLQIVFVLLGLGLVFGGNRLSMPFLLNTGIAFLGLFAITIGVEAIITRHIVVGRRRRGGRRTYTGIPAVLQGIQFNIIGLALIAVALMLQFQVGARGLFLQTMQHPGIALIGLGMLVMLQAAIAMAGSGNVGGGSVPAFVLLQLFPGLLLAIVALILAGLGLFEIVAPVAFDQMGGGILESLYGPR